MPTVRISFQMDERVNRQVLLDFCGSFGEIRSVNIPVNPRTHTPKGFAYIEFYEQQDAEDCVDNLDLGELYGRTVRVAHHAGKQVS